MRFENNFKKGGLGQRNVVPPEIKAIFDLRLATTTDPKEFEQMLVKWIAEAEGDDTDSGRIHYEFQSVIIDLNLTNIQFKAVFFLVFFSSKQ